MPDSQVVRLSAAAQALVAIETPQDAKRVIRLAEAARVFARQAELGAEAENAATAIRLKAEVRLAETVTAGQEAGEIATAQTGHLIRDAEEIAPATLRDIGVSPQRLSEAREIAAAFTLPAIDGMADDASEKGRTLSRAAVLREARAQGEDALLNIVTTEEDRYRENIDHIAHDLTDALLRVERVNLKPPDRDQLAGQAAYLVRRLKGTYDDDAFEAARVHPQPRLVG